MREVKVSVPRQRPDRQGPTVPDRYKLTEEEAAERYPKREPLETTEETRTILRMYTARTSSCSE